MMELIHAAEYALDVLNRERGKQARLRAIAYLKKALEQTRPLARPQHDVVDEGDYDLGLDGRPNKDRA